MAPTRRPPAVKPGALKTVPRRRKAKEEPAITKLDAAAIAMATARSRRLPGQEVPKDKSNDVRYLQIEAAPLLNDGPADVNNEEYLQLEDAALLAIEGPADVSDAVDPLRQMAEKVGREVESFATTLDQYLQGLPTREDTHGRYEAAQEVVQDFKSIAEKAVEERKKSHEKDRMLELRKEWSEQARMSSGSIGLKATTSFAASRSLSARASAQVKELREWQQEVDLWELFAIILELHYKPEDLVAQEREEVLAHMAQPHRYMPEAEVWDRFLAEDGLAKKRSLIKRWLEQTMDHQASDVGAIVEELEAKCLAGIWTRGWMTTRETIKGEKRLRSWPSGSDSVQPQIRSSTGDELLITTLDPDAPARQERALEQQDAYLERAMWVACWEMLRRGKSWKEIMAWCEERNEGWRAVVLGKASDSSNVVSNAAWRKICYLASQATSSYDYESAVFGLLGGNVEAVQKVCHTVDDHLYAYYNTMLLRQFDLYLHQHCPERFLAGFGKKPTASSSVQDASRAEEAVSELIERLRREKTGTHDESVAPLKILQSYMLADEVGSLITTVGTAISDLDVLHARDDGVIVRLRPGAPDQKMLEEAEIALDPRTLRMVAHVAIVLRGLRSQELEGDELDAEENVLVSYIQALRLVGTRDLIPLYASRLSRPRYIVTLAHVLQDIDQSSEQREMMSLLQSYDMDVVTICQEQLSSCLDAALRESTVPEGKLLSILEKAEDSKIYPGQRIIVEFLPDMLDARDESIVRSLEWFRFLPGEWKTTFAALALAVRSCLLSGRFACALEIVRHLPYDEVSGSKAYHAIGRTINIMDKTLPDPEDEHEAMQIQLMRRQSKTYYELEILVRTVEALNQWAIEERQHTSKLPLPLGGAPTALKLTKMGIDEAIAPLLHGILLNPVDEYEAGDLNRIRTAFFPEIILAYNTALYTAGVTITRDSLLESMDLSVAVANEANGLAEAFQQAGRMRELVQSFAQTSKLMLITKADRRPWKPKKDRVGKDLGMWEIGPQGSQVGGAHAADNLEQSQA